MLIKLIVASALCLPLSALKIIVHRGHPSYPENSLIGVQKALNSSYDGIEIDIQPLKNEHTDFALAHDLVINREIDFNKPFNSMQFTKSQWQNLNKRNRSLQTTTYKASTLTEVLHEISNADNRSIFLNIEIKSPMIKGIDLLKILEASGVEVSQVQISSMYLDKLETIRQYSSNVYLGVIFSPNTDSLEDTITNYAKKLEESNSNISSNKIQGFLSKVKNSKAYQQYSNHKYFNYLSG